MIRVICYVILWIALLSPGKCDSSDDDNLSKDWSYCFEFTWFGPDYNNRTIYNGTCSEYLDLTRARNVPCSPPIVISYDGTIPDIDYLWNNHRASVLCRKSENKVCASYTYYYNGVVNNATYMCTKATSVGEGPITSGCYSQKFGGYDMKTCICNSRPGLYKPCNASSSVTPTFLCTISFIIYLFHSLNF